jgi:hypothetical protein
MGLSFAVTPKPSRKLSELPAPPESVKLPIANVPLPVRISPIK